jgi:hypothetical protein
MGRVDEIFREMSALLGRYGFDSHVQYMDRLALLYDQDLPAFKKEVTGEMQSRSLWGGAGSVSDVSPIYGDYEDEAKAKKDELRFLELLVGLAEELESLGLATESARQRAATFRAVIRDERWSSQALIAIRAMPTA